MIDLASIIISITALLSSIFTHVKYSKCSNTVNFEMSKSSLP